MDDKQKKRSEKLSRIDALADNCRESIKRYVDAYVETAKEALDPTIERKIDDLRQQIEYENSSANRLYEQTKTDEKTIARLKARVNETVAERNSMLDPKLHFYATCIAEEGE